jgi:hypothetical protein
MRRAAKAQHAINKINVRGTKISVNINSPILSIGGGGESGSSVGSSSMIGTKSGRVGGSVVG